MLTTRAGCSRTLQDIYDFMKLAAEQKWAKRFMRKATIEDAIADYNAALDDAARAFQVIYDLFRPTNQLC